MATRPQQRSNLAESVDDNDHGQDGGGGAAERDDAQSVIDELSAEEVAALDGMRSGAAPSDGGSDQGGDQGGDGNGGDVEDDPDDDGTDGVGPGDREAREVRGDNREVARNNRGEQGDEPQQREPKTINYGRHQREMSKRDRELAEARAALEQERQKNTRLDERTRMLLDAINARKAPTEQEAAPAQQPQNDDPEPDADQDPLGHVQWQNRQLVRRVDELSQGRAREREEQQARSAEQQEIDNYTAELSAEAQQDPAIAEAFVYLRESRYAELGHIYAGININDPEECRQLTPVQQAQLTRQIQAAFASEQRMVYQAAKKGGRTVGKSVLGLARARGFNPDVRRQDEDQGQRREQQQEQRRPAAGGRQAPGRQEAPREQQQPRSVSEELDSIRAAAGASRSLSDAGGVPGGDIDLRRIAEMDDDEFNDLYSSVSKGKWDRMMGKQPG